MATKAKKVVASTGVLSADTNGGLPLWDEAHIHQENWGGNLGLPARKPGAVVDLRNTEQKIVVSTDAEQCELFRECIMSLSGIAGIGSCANLVVGWKRPAEIFAPFRPMVHRNMTPFLNPYDKRPAVYDSKEVAVASSGKKSDAKTGVPPPPLHVQYPEIVQVLESPAAEMVVGEQSELMNACVVERYRELQPLMQAYDLEVELGCAATPAEACASRYSTALRHRLDQATALSKLSEPPPFVMSAFNTAIRFIEQQQSVIKSGDYLWELVYPHASDTCHPVYNPYGKYCVRLFIDGAYRQVTIDDYLPVDALGRPFFTVTSQKEIWPALVAKAIFIALGTSRHLLFTDPETIISCLFGEWVPERINPRAQPATACALLLGVNKESLFNDSTATHYSISTSQTPRRGMDCSESPLGHGTFSDGQARSGSRSAVSLARTCTLNADGHEGKEESDDTSAHVVCLVGTMPCETRKLFVVHNVVYFRNTLAIQISTNPPSTVIEAGMLTLDNKDEAVQELLKFSPYAELEHRGARGLSSQTSSTSMFWITLEELSEKLNILVWRKIGADSPFICHQRITSGESPSHPNTIKKRRNSTGPLGSTPPPLKRSVTRWMHITSEKAEKLAIVSLASPFPTVTAAAASAGSPLNSWSTAAPHTSYHSVAHLSDLKGCREVLLDLYNWDRGDVFSHSASFAYETGKLQCLVHDVPPGSHVFRLTTYGLEAQQVICVFATREFIFGEERDALRSANIFKVSDAGSHVSVDRVGEETVWFKRRFTLKEPTLISAVVTTLDPSEDPAAHRDIPGPAVKEPKAQKLRSAIQKTPTKDSVEDTTLRSSMNDIIPYCHVLLIDLDTSEIRRGAVGHLVQQQLEPNHKGYLLIAYSLIDATSAATISNVCTTSPVDASIQREDSEIKAPSNAEKDPGHSVDTPAPLFGKGLWKLVLLSDRALDSYKLVPKDVSMFSDRGQLRRGSLGLLFSYTCMIVDRTDITILVDVESCDPMPFFLRIVRVGVDAPPVFTSEVCTSHIFVPHASVEMAEKTKYTSYSIEAWLDAGCLERWEQKRRAAQEAKYTVLRDEAERRASARRQQELEDNSSDPVAFKERLIQQDTTQIELVESTPRDTSSAFPRKSRYNAEKRKTQTAILPNERSSQKNSLGVASQNSSTLLIDSTDDALMVTYDVRLSFSSKTDVKAGAPLKDLLAHMRASWVPPIEHPTESLNTPPARSPGFRVKQKEAGPSHEELMKADQGRLSRQRFLDNPRNTLFPYLMQVNEPVVPAKDAPRSAAMKDVSTASATTTASLMAVVTDVREEANFDHASVMSECDYCSPETPLCPLGNQSSANIPSFGSLLAARQFLNRSLSEQTGLRHTNVSLSTSVSPVQMEEDTDVMELRAPMHDLGSQLTEEVRRGQEGRMALRDSIKGLVNSYWSARKPSSALISLLGLREEDGGKRLKPRAKSAGVL